MSGKKLERPQDIDPFVVFPTVREDENVMVVLKATVGLLKQHWKFILLIALAAGSLTFGYASLLPRQFTATASFIPPNSSSGSAAAAALVGQLAGGAGSLFGASRSSGDLYVSMLRSRTIASSLVEQFHLKSVYHAIKESQAEQTLGSHSEFVGGSRDPIVYIKVTETDPVLARDMANAYLDTLRATSANLSLTENSQRRKFFEQRLSLEKDQLANAEIALKQGQERSGLIAPAGQTSTQLGAIAQLRSQLGSKEVQLASLRQDESEQNPDVLRLKSEIGSLNVQINRLQRGGRDESGAISTAQVPALQLDYIRREREVKYHETLFEILSKQYEAAKLDEAHDPTLEILDRAITPDTKSGPHRLSMAQFGFLGGLVCACLWVFLRAARAGTLSGSTMVARSEVAPEQYSSFR